jgi:hypothetical protein
MFPKANASTLTQRTLAGLRLCRSFLMLEDDDAVDWEVGWTERAELAEHPHRAALRERRTRGHEPRRPGQPSPAVQVCTSPIRDAAPYAYVAIARRPRRRRRELHR